MNPVWKNSLLHTILVEDIYRFYEREDLLQCLEHDVTYITIVLVSIKSPSSQLTGAFRLYLSQGATAVVHGCSIRALDPNAE